MEQGAWNVLTGVQAVPAPTGMLSLRIGKQIECSAKQKFLGVRDPGTLFSKRILAALFWRQKNNRSI